MSDFEPNPLQSRNFLSTAYIPAVPARERISITDALRLKAYENLAADSDFQEEVQRRLARRRRPMSWE